MERSRAEQEDLDDTDDLDPTLYDPLSAPLQFCPELADYLWDSDPSEGTHLPNSPLHRDEDPERRK